LDSILEWSMHDHAFLLWRSECDAIDEEMDGLIKDGFPATVEERRVRRTRFAALIERRQTAARNLLQSDRALRGRKTPLARSSEGNSPSSGDHLSSDEAVLQSDTAAIHPGTVVLREAAAPAPPLPPPISLDIAALPNCAAPFRTDAVARPPDAEAPSVLLSNTAAYQSEADPTALTDAVAFAPNAEALSPPPSHDAALPPDESTNASDDGRSDSLSTILKVIERALRP